MTNTNSFPRKTILLLPLIAVIGAAGWLIADRSIEARQPGDGNRRTRLNTTIEALTPLHTPIRPPGPSDWLAQHDEPGQTFKQYLASDPVRPTDQRNRLYVLPLGRFDATQRRIIDLTADYMDRFFALPVTVQDPLPLSAIPDSARRVHPNWGVRQILSTYVLTNVLLPRLPDDAAAYIAFTTSDLWPGENWNFVFGQASIHQRVGVWSIYRNGDPSPSGDAFRLCLRRTLKTAVHETGHMFSLYHCTAWECVMCGSNHREESDRRPLWLCPECLAKICWATETDPAARYRELSGFCDEQGLDAEAAFFKQSITALEAARLTDVDSNAATSPE